MPQHRVRQGETTSRIAYEAGFFRETIWHHPENAPLRQQREHENILLPGDVLYIPDRQHGSVPGATAQRHRFRLKGVPERLRIRLLDQHDEPRCNLPYVLEIDGVAIEGRTDADGLVEHPIPPNARRGRLLIGPSRAEEHLLQLGHLDPVDETSGLQARLYNLGVFFGGIDGEMDQETGEAILEFQREQGLEETGRYDDTTRARLEALHRS